MLKLLPRNVLPLLLILALVTGCNPAGSAQPAAPTMDATSVAATLQAAAPPTGPTAPAVNQLPTGALPPPPTPTALLRGPYAVIQVPRNDTLNMRQGPGIKYRVVDRLAPDTINVQLTGKTEMVGDARWVEAVRPNGSGTGWVSSVYLTEYVAPKVFCADGRVPQLLDQVGQAFIQQDGKLLSTLVSPGHGLDVTYLRTGNTASYTPEEARWMFESTYQMNWGTHPASGLEIKGPFHEKVLPNLLDVLNNPHESICNNPAMGGSNYTFQWPPRYRNINFYALYKPGPAGEELAWRTWLAGVEYVNGQPYLFALLQLFWEP